MVLDTNHESSRCPLGYSSTAHGQGGISFLLKRLCKNSPEALPWIHGRIPAGIHPARIPWAGIHNQVNEKQESPQPHARHTKEHESLTNLDKNNKAGPERLNVLSAGEQKEGEPFVTSERNGKRKSLTVREDDLLSWASAQPNIYKLFAAD